MQKQVGSSEDVLASKNMMINPDFFVKNGVAVHRLEQNPGEFVITCPQVGLCNVSAQGTQYYSIKST